MVDMTRALSSVCCFSCINDNIDKIITNLSVND